MIPRREQVIAVKLAADLLTDCQPQEAETVLRVLQYVLYMGASTASFGSQQERCAKLIDELHRVMFRGRTKQDILDEMNTLVEGAS